MQNKDWFETGEEILSSVLDAIDKQDYAGLSKNIEKTVNDALEGIHKKINDTDKKYNATEEWIRQKQERTAREALVRQAAQIKNSLPVLYKKNPPGTFLGTACKVLGIVGTSITGIAFLVLLITAMATHTWGVWLASCLTGCLLGGSVALTVYGVKKEHTVDRFRTYVKLVGEKQYCEISRLAAAVGKKTEYVKKELRHMISKGFFLQGHIDQAETTLITSDFMYEKYLAAELSRQNRVLEEKKRQEIEVQNSAYPEKVQKIIEEGEEYIRRVHEANDAIPGAVMSQKLATLEDIMKRIFEQLKKNPESSDDLQKLMKYYLPTTAKLIDAYRDLDGKPAYGGSNIANTKKEIEDTLDVINDAFAKLFDDMFEEAAWDISSEISTMKTILAKEGLTGERDFWNQGRTQ